LAQIYISIFSHACLSCDFSNPHMAYYSCWRYYYAESAQAVTLQFNRQMSSSEPAVLQLIHLSTKVPGTTGVPCHCTRWRVLTVCPALRFRGLFQLEQGCQLRCPGVSPDVQSHSSCLHFPFDKPFLMLQPTLCFAALHAKKLSYSTSKLAVFKGWINCSLCMQFGTGVHGPLCVLGPLLFKIAVYH